MLQQQSGYVRYVCMCGSVHESTMTLWRCWRSFGGTGLRMAPAPRRSRGPALSTAVSAQCGHRLCVEEVAAIAEEEGEGGVGKFEQDQLYI